MQKHIEDKIIFLNKEIELRIKAFESRRISNRRKAFFLKIIAAFISASITILLGIGSVDETLKLYFKDIALFLSSSLTIVSIWDAFFNNKDLWIKYTDTTNELKELKSDINYYIIDKDDSIIEEEVDNFYIRYKGILDSTNSYWIKTKVKRDQKTRR